jgi:tetratricopeptide (TPR) repeat protein
MFPSRRKGAVSMARAKKQNITTNRKVFLMDKSSEAILVASRTRNDTSPDAISLGVEESYELGLRFWQEAQYGAARACVWPFTRPKYARQVDCVLGLSYHIAKMGNLLAVIDISEGQFGRALGALEMVGPHVRECDDLILTGHFETHIGIARQERHEYDAAIGHFRDALAAYEGAGARRYAEDSENNLAMTFIRRGNPDIADRHITRALQSCDDPLTLAQILDTRSRQELSYGRFDEAKQLITEAIGIASRLSGVDAYLAGFARTFAEISAAEVAQLEKAYSLK